MMARKIIRLPKVLAISGLSRSTIYFRIAEGKFPAQIPLGARAVGWDEDEVNTWIEQQVAQSSNRAAIHVERAADEIGASSAELREFVESGELPSYRLGRHVLVKISALEKFKTRRHTAKNSDG